MAIICRHYGYSLGHVTAGNGTIWLDEVSCRGTETDIASCPHKSWGINDCDHNEDVSVRCTEPTTTGIDLIIYLFLFIIYLLFIIYYLLFIIFYFLFFSIIFFLFYFFFIYYYLLFFIIFFLFFIIYYFYLLFIIFYLLFIIFYFLFIIFYLLFIIFIYYFYLLFFIYFLFITFFIFFYFLFIIIYFLSIYDKWPESATDMPMTVNSKITHYKIREISTENKRFKNRQTAKMV